MKSIMRFNTNQKEMRGLNGLRIISVKPLDESEYVNIPVFTVTLENGRSVTAYETEIVTSFVSDNSKEFSTREEALAEDTFTRVETGDFGAAPFFYDNQNEFFWFRPKNKEEIEAIRLHYGNHGEMDPCDAFSDVRPREWFCVEVFSGEVMGVYPLSAIVHDLNYFLRKFGLAVASFTKDRHDSVVAFPCKLHDTVWFATQYGVMSGNVSSLYFNGKTHISISSNRNAESPNFAAFAVSAEDIGKKIFFTKEEAEKCDFRFSVLRLCCN